MNEPTQNAILRISDAKTLQLIDLYSREPCLWDTTDPHYRTRARRQRAAEKIARLLDIDNFEAKHVITKFKNLRNSYCQELKKIANSLHSGVGEELQYRPRVIWFNKMHSFLQPHLQTSRNDVYLIPQLDVSETSRDIEIKKEKDADLEDVLNEDASDSGEIAEEWVQLSNPEEVLLPQQQTDHHTSDDDAPVAKKVRKRSLQQRRGRPGLPAAVRSVTHSCIERGQTGHVLRQIARQLERLEHRQDDPFDSFGRYVASLLRSLPAARALALQPRIVQLLTAAATGLSDATVSQSDENI